MALQEGIFRLFNPLSDEAQIDSELMLANLLFAKDDKGNPIYDCGYTIKERIDDNYIKVWICTTDEVWSTAGNYTAPQTTIVENEDGTTSEVIEDKPLLILLEMKLTCSECGAEWWGLPDGSGLCAECATKVDESAELEPAPAIEAEALPIKNVVSK